MIGFAEIKHKRGIIELWHEAFGDSYEEINIIVDEILKYMVIFEENDEVKGMLALLPVSCAESKGRYIYAVATLKKWRGNGISTKLLEFAKQVKSDFLILVPQTSELYDFYEKRGFFNISCTQKCETVSQRYDDIVYQQISTEQYLEKRKLLCNDCMLIEWSADMLKLAKKMYGGKFLSICSQNRENGVAFCFISGKTLYVKEILAEDTEKSAQMIGYSCGAEKVIYIKKEHAEASAMMYPKAVKNIYFNIAMD